MTRLRKQGVPDTSMPHHNGILDLTRGGKIG